MTQPSISITDASQISVTNPTAEVEVVTVQVPGITGPAGSQGPPGQANVLTIGTVATGAPGSSASATISGVSPNQVLNLTIPQGPDGTPGAAGPANTLTIGTVTTVDAVTGGSATITGTSPNQVLNLTLPRGYGVIPGGTQYSILAKNSATDYDTAWFPSTNAASAGTVMTRDANGRAQVVDPAVAADIATKNYADTKASIAGDLGGTAASPQVTSGTHHTHTSSQISDATSAATASKVIIRDANGRASVADPSVSTDIATKNYTDTQVATKAAIAGDLGGTAASPQVTGGTHHTHTSSQISDAASAATVSKVVIRDAAGRAQFVDPSAAADAATKNYVDTQVATKAAIAGDIGGTAAAPQVTGGTHHSHTSSQISDAASANTASKVVIRDASARAQFADPSAAQDAATKNYVDTKLPGKVTVGTVAPSSPATNDIWIDTN